MVKRMKSADVRANWREVLTAVQNGETIEIEHYNRPVARIAPIEETRMTTAVTREALLVWLGDNHGLTDEGISTLLNKAAEIGRQWPSPTDHKQSRMDRLWWAYQEIVTAAAPSQQAALDTIHGKGRTGVDPWKETGTSVFVATVFRISNPDDRKERAFNTFAEAHEWMLPALRAAWQATPPDGLSLEDWSQMTLQSGQGINTSDLSFRIEAPPEARYPQQMGSGRSWTDG